MEEKYYVDIKDDFGKVRTFEVPTLAMKEAIDNIDNEIKEEYKPDALRYSTFFSAYGSYADNLGVKIFEEPDDIDYEPMRKHLYKVLWRIIKGMKNKKYKKIVYMRFKQGMKFNAIAKALNCSNQSITDNYRTAMADLKVIWGMNKEFQETYYFKHFTEYLQKESKIIATQRIKQMQQTQNLASLTSVDKMIKVFDEIKAIQKKEKKLDINDNPIKTLKEQKFKVFGKEYSVADMLNVVGDFLEPFREK